MGKSDRADDSDTEVVAVTKHGQTTIPKRFRDTLGIDAPGRVQFRETAAGEVFVEPVRSPSEMRGFAARSEATTDRPATELLREKRAQDRDERNDRFLTEE